MTKHKLIFDALAAPFGRDEVKQITGYDYVTIRTVMNRLDEVLGPENWWDRRSDTKRGVKCRLTIRLPDGSTATHEGHARHMPDPPRSAHAAERIAAITESLIREKAERAEEARRWNAIQLADDGTEADAFKRAAVKFGVARYLYRDGIAELTDAPAAAQIAATPPPPAPPARAVVGRGSPDPAPEPDRRSPVRAGSEDAQGRGGKSVYGQAGAKGKAPTPKSGEDLHHYAADNPIDPNLANWIVNSFNPQGFPSKIIDWNPDEVRQALPSIKEHLVTVAQSRARMKATS